MEKVCSNVLILRQGEVVAYDSIERLRELIKQRSLEGVFGQLAEVDDGDEVAGRIQDHAGQLAQHGGTHRSIHGGAEGRVVDVRDDGSVRAGAGVGWGSRE